jgi:hypothetical protein
MTLKEFKRKIDELPQEYDDCIMIFGVAYSSMEVGDIYVTDHT